jgi:hypothetical protein
MRSEMDLDDALRDYDEFYDEEDYDPDMPDEEPEDNRG